MIIPTPRFMKNPKKEEQNRQLRKENFWRKANSHLAKRASENNLNYKKLLNYSFIYCNISI